MNDTEKEAVLHHTELIEEHVDQEVLCLYLFQALPEYETDLYQFLEQESGAIKDILQFLTTVPTLLISSA